MALTKKQLLEYANSLPDDEEMDDNVEAEEAPAGEAEKEPNAEAVAEETTVTETANPEDVEVDAPPIQADVVVMTSEDMVEESLDMRLATFYKKQTELENTVKILLGEVKQLKEHFSDIETAIDTASETSPVVADMAELINRI